MHNNLKTLSKSENELIVGNHIVLFGGRDLAGEYFTKSTRFESGYTESGLLYVDFEHGLDPDRMGIDDSHVLGFVDWKSAKVDEKGIFVERVLNRRARYVDFLIEMIDAGLIGNSSEAVTGKTMRKRDGEITQWPLMRDTLTLTPMEPRMLSSNVLSAAKSLAAAFPHSKALSEIVKRDPILTVKTIEELDSLSEIERHLRDSCGLSKSEATALVSRVKSVIGRGDPGEGADLRDAQAKASAVLAALRNR